MASLILAQDKRWRRA